MKGITATTFCAIAAGFAGGAASQAIFSPPAASAQTARIVPPGTSENTAPRELSAERFVMTDTSGRVRGELKIENGNPEIILYGSDGKAIWKAPSASGFRLLGR